MWWLETLALAYLGLACLARGNHRFHALTLPGDHIARPMAARVAGWLLLAAAGACACRALGVAQGLVALACGVAAAGLPLVLLLSVRPRAALAPTIPLLLPGSARRHPSRR